ncbi:MAG: DUF4339 domain-containing protein, partial [Roseibacillus sp.]
MDIWHYLDKHNQSKQIVEDELVPLANAGEITPQTNVWREGMANWSPASSVLPQLFADVPSNPPALPPGTALGGVPGQKCHEVDYEILGDGMQIVAIELDHGERRQQRKRRGVGSWWTWELAGRGLENHHLDPLGWIMIP